MRSRGILRPSVANTSKHRLIAHALGSIDGVAGCNCREAFEHNYQLGYRLFEVDLAPTSDGEVVALHAGYEAKIGLDRPIDQVTRSVFSRKKFLDTYAPLDLDGVLELLEQHPDATLVLDTKEKFSVLMPQVVQRIRARNPALIQRIIPQIYQTNQLSQLKSLYPFHDIIFTLYLTELSDEALIAFLLEAPEISGVTVWEERYSTTLRQQLEQLDRAIFVHTINDLEAVDRFLDDGVGVYSDFYRPEN